MMRSILIAAVVGVLAAVPASYLLTAPARQDRAATSARAGNDVFGMVTPAEAWPICSTMSAMTETPDWAALDPDFAAGKRAIVVGDWNGAINAMRHYQQALRLNPRHRSAHEHLGEAYLVQRDLTKAEEHLAALKRICLIPCD